MPPSISDIATSDDRLCKPCVNLTNKPYFEPLRVKLFSIGRREMHCFAAKTQSKSRPIFQLLADRKIFFPVQMRPIKSLRTSQLHGDRERLLAFLGQTTLSDK
jgi:hypothetical protein